MVVKPTAYQNSGKYQNKNSVSTGRVRIPVRREIGGMKEGVEVDGAGW